MAIRDISQKRLRSTFYKEGKAERLCVVIEIYTYLLPWGS